MNDHLEIEELLEIVDIKLDEVEEIVAGLPVRPGNKKIIMKMIYDLYAEIEDAVEVSAVDFE